MHILCVPIHILQRITPNIRYIAKSLHHAAQMINSCLSIANDGKMKIIIRFSSDIKYF